jgi:NAD(P)-dependent dehydrogenase (short-subunit alcohol dehydrogenase family)
MMNLRDQHVAVLGGSSGIGLATAMAAAEQGARVTIVSRNIDKALAAMPAGTAGRSVDLSDARAVTALFEDLGAVDHLVYTAGEPLALMPLDILDVDTARDFFTVRYFGALAAVRAARVRESITLTTGIAKDRPGPGWAVAASICGAIEALTKALAVELAPIRVNAVSPGVVRTPLWSGLTEDDRDQMYRETAARIPAGRVGEVGDIAEAYLFCMTQDFATGTVVTVDGGTVLV